MDSLLFTSPLWTQVNKSMRHPYRVTSLFITHIIYISCIGSVLPMPSALNIFQLMNHNPRGTVIHSIHANFWVFLDPSLPPSTPPPLFWLLLHRGILPLFRLQHDTIIIDSCTIKAGQSKTDSYETRLAKFLSETEVWWLTRPWPSASSCLCQLLFDRKGFFPQCAKTQLST